MKLRTFHGAFFIVALFALSATSCSQGYELVEIMEFEESQPQLLRVVTSSCTGGAHVTIEVAQSSEQIVIGIRPHDEDLEECADAWAVGIQEPVGEREVIDASSGEPVSVTP